MKRRRPADATGDRLPLLWEALHILDMWDLRASICGEHAWSPGFHPCRRFAPRGEPSKGDRAILAAIEEVLTVEEAEFVRRLAGGEVYGAIVEHLPPLPPGQEEGYIIHKKAGVRWGRNGYEPDPDPGRYDDPQSEEVVVDLDERRKPRGGAH